MDRRDDPPETTIDIERAAQDPDYRRLVLPLIGPLRRRADPSADALDEAARRPGL